MRVRAASRRAEQVAGTTRERLIEAAGDVIAEAGYDRAGVQEIARRAGLTNGAIYANFRDKSELLAEAVEVGLVRLFGRMDDARDAGASPAEVIEMIGRTLALNTPARNRTLISEALAAARRDPDVGERVRQLLRTLETHVACVVEEARGDGDIGEDVDPATVARFGVALAIGYHVTYAAGLPEPDHAAWTRLMTRVVGSLRA
jgi:AcrR family transcriptional regulator